MEPQLQVEEMPIISRQHASGEVFQAENIEAARGVCPILGRLSLEEANLLLELEVMGKEQLTNKPDMSDKSATDIPDIKHADAAEKAGSPPTTENKHHKTVAEAALIYADYTEDVQARATKKQSGVSITTEENAYSVNPVREKPSRKKQPAFLVQNEVSRSVTTVYKPIEEQVEVAVHKETEPAWTAEETKPDYVSMDAAGATEITREAAGNLTQINQQPRQNAVLAQANEFIAQPEMPELIVAAGPTAITQIKEFTYEDSLEPPQEEAMLAAGHEAPLKDVKEQSEAEAFRPAAVEPETAMSMPELPMPVEEIKTVVTQLTEVLSLAEPKESQKCFQVLKEIITLPAGLESVSDKEGEALEQNLQELFTELFEEAGIDYTPELIKSLVILTRMHYLEELLKPVNKDEEQGLPDEVGTREFLQKILQRLNNTKRSIMNFYEIGQAILRLYNQPLPLPTPQLFNT